VPPQAAGISHFILGTPTGWRGCRPGELHLLLAGRLVTSADPRGCGWKRCPAVLL